MNQILFTLEVQDDYPPVAVESLWAEKLSSGEFKIRNIPFYTKEVSLEDTVFIRQEATGCLAFDSISQDSGNSTIRIVFFEPGKPWTNKILDSVLALGCSWEGMSRSFFSINIPKEKSFDNVISLLENAASKKWLDYEYGMIHH